MGMTADHELKTKHRAMWSSGDYPQMVETFLLPRAPCWWTPPG